MIRYFLVISAACLSLACTPIDPLKPQSPAEFFPTNAAADRQPILPDGVAVLYDYPKCGFQPLGEGNGRSEQPKMISFPLKRFFYRWV